MLVQLDAELPELSFLLHKHPDKLHSQSTAFGDVHVFYPSQQRVVLMLEIDPLKLTRRGQGSEFVLQPYVNDRPYVASSMLSVALNQVFRTAMAPRCQSHPELVEQPIALRFEIPVLPCRGGETLLRRLFEPLGYEVDARALPVDPAFPGWGDSPYFHVVLTARCALYRALRHLYILMPVLDNDKHYWVGDDEVEKLVQRGEDWLSEHPERELIVDRYLRYRRDLRHRALSELVPLAAEDVERDQAASAAEEKAERRLGLHDQRLNAVSALLEERAIRSVADLGCGEGRLLRRLLKLPNLSKILACDVSPVALERAARGLERASEAQRARVHLFQSSLLYADSRLEEIEAAVLVEVIEHVEPAQLPRLVDNLFGKARPKLILITTPNSEYNVVWESLPAGRFRHSDHRFEWSRDQFRDWCEAVRGDYQVEISGLGDPHELYGSPSQMAVFQR